MGWRPRGPGLRVTARVTVFGLNVAWLERIGRAAVGLGLDGVSLMAANPDCEVILYVYTPVPLPGMFDEARRQGFAFPETLDEWLSPRWRRYENRRDPGTPWLSPPLLRRIHDFETVLHARHPSVSDRYLRRWQRGFLRALAAPRARSGCYARPWELRLLPRLWRYRRPEEMGF